MLNACFFPNDGLRCGRVGIWSSSHSVISKSTTPTDRLKITNMSIIPQSGDKEWGIFKTQHHMRRRDIIITSSMVSGSSVKHRLPRLGVWRFARFFGGSSFFDFPMSWRRICVLRPSFKRLLLLEPRERSNDKTLAYEIQTHTQIGISANFAIKPWHARR